MSKLEELKAEADKLGVKYSPNIGEASLQKKVEEKYAELDTDGADVKPVEVKEELVETKPAGKKETSIQAVIRKNRKKAAETKVVKISNMDKREASYATSAYFNSGVHSMRVPLDEFVEMPISLIDLAERAKALVHVEVNGEVMPKRQKKYVVEYKRD